jgi:hypothetical protein
MKRTLHLLTLLLALFWAGCEQIIEIDLPEHEPQLVVNAVFCPDSTFKARVTHSRDRLQPYGLYEVTNATVLIKENGVILDTLLHDSADVYLPVRGVEPQAGHTYTLEASAPGYETVMGTDHIPSAVIPYDITWTDSVGVYEGNEPYGEIRFKIDDPGGIANFYTLQMYSFDSLVYPDTVIYERLPVYYGTTDPIFEGEPYYGMYWEDVTFDGNTREIRVSISSYSYDYIQGRAFMAFTTCSESFFKYLRSASDYWDANFNPFAEPVRYYSNMSPAMGIFAGYVPTISPLP